jgi:hypothetical protein
MNKYIDIEEPFVLRSRSLKKSSIPGFDEGHVQIELLDTSDKPIPGFSGDECAPLKGHHHGLQVKRSGGQTTPKEASKARFYLKRVSLYGFDLREKN